MKIKSLLTFAVPSFLLLCVKVLGHKPELPEGDDNDDEAADITNRRIAKLFMVRTES